MSATKIPRILALDLGTRRIGMAVSDELGITAQGLETLERSNKRADLARIEEVLGKYEVAEIVVGHPIRMSGVPSTQSEKAVAFADELRDLVQIPVHLWDERLTSSQANRLLDEAGRTRIQRKGVVDRMAAALILQEFMEARRLRK